LQEKLLGFADSDSHNELASSHRVPTDAKSNSIKLKMSESQDTSIMIGTY